MKQTNEELELGVPRKKRGKPVRYDNAAAENAAKNLERLKRSVYRSPVFPMFGQTYFWCFGFTDLGKTVVLGPYMTRDELEVAAIGLDKHEVFTMKTRDKSRATQQIKAELLERGENPDEALRRMLHSVPKEKPKKAGHKRWW